MTRRVRHSGRTHNGGGKPTAPSPITTPGIGRRFDPGVTHRSACTTGELRVPETPPEEHTDSEQSTAKKYYMVQPIRDTPVSVYDGDGQHVSTRREWSTVSTVEHRKNTM